MNKISAIFLLVLLSGCSSMMIQSPTSEYGPSDGRQIGKIVYDPFLFDAREGAYKKMYRACNGNYKILEETTEQKNQKTTYDAHMTPSDGFKGTKTTESDEYVTITFECLKSR